MLVPLQIQIIRTPVANGPYSSSAEERPNMETIKGCKDTQSRQPPLQLKHFSRLVEEKPSTPNLSIRALVISWRLSSIASHPSNIAQPNQSKLVILIHAHTRIRSLPPPKKSLITAYHPATPANSFEPSDSMLIPLVLQRCQDNLIPSQSSSHYALSISPSHANISSSSGPLLAMGIESFRSDPSPLQ